MKGIPVKRLRRLYSVTLALPRNHHPSESCGPVRRRKTATDWQFSLE